MGQQKPAVSGLCEWCLQPGLHPGGTLDGQCSRLWKPGHHAGLDGCATPAHAQSPCGQGGDQRGCVRPACGCAAWRPAWPEREPGPEVAGSDLGARAVVDAPGSGAGPARQQAQYGARGGDGSDRAVMDPCMDASRQQVVTRIQVVNKSSAALYPALSVVDRLSRLATGPDVIR